MPDTVHKIAVTAPIAVALHHCCTSSPGTLSHALTANFVPLTIPASVKASSFLHRFIQQHLVLILQSILHVSHMTFLNQESCHTNASAVFSV